ncbi:MAG TPA: glycosyltransferase family 2 protein [Candidatus Magasanikbacteria bacterium]|nr:glycosyltransferase family 2 protein [Candidatus Magasanikbacteria bacterium]
MNLSVIIVTYNTLTHQSDLFRSCLRSISDGADGISFEIIVADNGSTDDTVAMLKREFSNVKIIENGANLGFGRANNIGAKEASGDYLLFLNPDNIVQSGSLKYLVDWMQTHMDVGIVGPKMIDQNGSLNKDATPRRFPGSLDQVAILLKLSHMFPKLLSSYMYEDRDFNQSGEVDSVRGAFIFMRRELYTKMGFAFDPRYFLWFEDVDTCRECWRHGYKVMYLTDVACIDHVSQTFKKIGNVWKQKKFTESMVAYFRKWHSVPAWLLIFLLRPIAVGMVIFHESIMNIFHREKTKI